MIAVSPSQSRWVCDAKTRIKRQPTKQTHQINPTNNEGNPNRAQKCGRIVPEARNHF
jgi:hypothetical protein